MKRAILILLVVCGTASAHVGSPDVFFDGDAGPYPVFVTVRMPQVIPGVAEIEIRTRAPDVAAMTVVPMRLSGPGSELPPVPDTAERSADDPQFFTARLWLMERGSLQVRIDVDGARGPGRLAVPIPAAAQRTLGMDRRLGALLLGLLLVLALSFVSIAGAAMREGGLEPGAQPTPRARTRARLVIAGASVVVVGALWGGNHWWTSQADAYEAMVAKPWKIAPRVTGCTLEIGHLDTELMLDHDHEMHLFIVRTPSLDRLAHLHPTRDATGTFVQALPSLPAGHYAVFADIVVVSGYPVTGTAEIDLPALDCRPPTDDDALWTGEPARDLTLDPISLRANIPVSLRLHATGAPLVPYMGMAGHAAILKADGSTFAHLHPNGSVAMPALMLAHAPHAMYAPDHVLPPELSFPYGFPSAGDYRMFVQVRRSSPDGPIETAAFDLHVDP